MSKTVAIDCFPESVPRYRDDCAIVAVDVIRATTTAVTGVEAGRQCFPVPSIEAAVPLAGRLTNPLLVGELGGNKPYGFDITNSPAQVAARRDIHRPMILLSTSGTRVICSAEGAEAVYVACLRNYRAQARHLITHHERVALIGAGARNEFREEDELCCAWIAECLVDAGYQPADENTAAIVSRWRGAAVDAICNGNSAEYLRRTAQSDDLDFVLTHVDDLNDVYYYERGEIVQRGASRMMEAS